MRTVIFTWILLVSGVSAHAQDAGPADPADVGALPPAVPPTSPPPPPPTTVAPRSVVPAPDPNTTFADVRNAGMLGCGIAAGAGLAVCTMGVLGSLAFAASPATSPLGTLVSCLLLATVLGTGPAAAIGAAIGAGLEASKRGVPLSTILLGALPGFGLEALGLTALGVGAVVIIFNSGAPLVIAVASGAAGLIWIVSAVAGGPVTAFGIAFASESAVLEVQKKAAALTPAQELAAKPVAMAF